MLAACRLAGLSALEAHYAGTEGRAQCRAAAIRPRGEKARRPALFWQYWQDARRPFPAPFRLPPPDWREKAASWPVKASANHRGCYVRRRGRDLARAQ
jgi:hypothetical protein